MDKNTRIVGAALAAAAGLFLAGCDNAEPEEPAAEEEVAEEGIPENDVEEPEVGGEVGDMQDTGEDPEVTEEG